MAVHEVHKFTDKKFDNLHVTNTYTREQVQIFPSGIQQYKSVDLSLVAAMCQGIVDQNSLQKIDEPDVTGLRC